MYTYFLISNNEYKQNILHKILNIFICNYHIITFHSEYRHDKKPGCCSVRWVVAYMGMWMGFITYLMNANMSIAVVCMMQGRNNETINNGGHKVVHSRIKSDDHVTNSTNHFPTVEFLALNESLAYIVNSTQGSIVVLLIYFCLSKATISPYPGLKH